tara:strand:+ start:1544 stop:2032 length:489 start_codon:yes stop_codon:yes gene_type:complete
VIIGVTGDTHNNLKNINEICTIFNQNSTDLVLHTGDISLPKSLLAFKQLNCPLISVIGNNDVEERKDLEEISKKFDCEIVDEPYYLELKDLKIAVLHHPELINSEMLLNNDLILHGHTHRFRLEKKNNCLIFNPGECAGFMKGKNQVGIINTEILKPEVINF